MKKVLGEFTLIVCGVLAALWGESLVSNASDTNRALGYLQDLEASVRIDSVRLNSWESLLNNREESTLQLIRFIDGQSMDADSVHEHLLMASSPFIELMERAVYDDLISSGNIRLLNSPELRRALITYYHSIDMWSKEIDRLALLGTDRAMDELVWSLPMDTDNPDPNPFEVRDSDFTVNFLKDHVHTRDILNGVYRQTYQEQLWVGDIRWKNDNLLALLNQSKQ